MTTSYSGGSTGTSSQAWANGSRHNFTMCLSFSPVTVLTFTWWTCPSGLTCISIIRARSHLEVGVSVSLMRKIELTLIWSSTSCQRARDWRVLKYSDFQRHQKSSRIFVTNLYLEAGVMSKLIRPGSGKGINAWPTRKRPGVRGARSTGFLLRETRGLELKHALIWNNSVVISSKVRVNDAMALFQWCLTDFTWASQSPPSWEARGAMKPIPLVFLRGLRKFLYKSRRLHRTCVQAHCWPQRLLTHCYSIMSVNDRGMTKIAWMRLGMPWTWGHIRPPNGWPLLPCTRIARFNPCRP